VLYTVFFELNSGLQQLLQRFCNHKLPQSIPSTIRLNVSDQDLSKSAITIITFFCGRKTRAERSRYPTFHNEHPRQASTTRQERVRIDCSLSHAAQPLALIHESCQCGVLAVFRHLNMSCIAVDKLGICLRYKTRRRVSTTSLQPNTK